MGILLILSAIAISLFFGLHRYTTLHGVPQFEPVADAQFGITNALYIVRTIDEYTQVTDTQEVKRDGKTFEQQSVRSAWQPKHDNLYQVMSSQFTLDGRTLPTTSDTLWLLNLKHSTLMPVTRLSHAHDAQPHLGDRQVTILGISAGQPVTVIKHLGQTIVSTHSPADTVHILRRAHALSFWTGQIVAWLLLVWGLMISARPWLGRLPTGTAALGSVALGSVILVLLNMI